MIIKIKILFSMVIFGLIACGYKSYSNDDTIAHSIKFDFSSNKKCLYVDYMGEENSFLKKDIHLKSILVTADNLLNKVFYVERISDNKMYVIKKNQCIDFENLENNSYRSEGRFIAENNKKYFFTILTDRPEVSYYQCVFYKNNIFHDCE